MNETELRKIKLLMKKDIGVSGQVNLPPWGAEATVSWLSCPQAVLTFENNIYFMTTDMATPTTMYIIKHNLITGLQTTIYTHEFSSVQSIREPDCDFVRDGDKLYLFLYDNNSNSLTPFTTYDMYYFEFQNDALVRFTTVPITDFCYFNGGKRNVAVGADGSLNCIIDCEPGLYGIVKNYRSIDNGVTWVPNVVVDLTSVTASSRCHAVCIDSVTGYLYAAIQISTNKHILIYKSTDNGLTWSSISNITPAATASTNLVRDFFIYGGNLYIVTVHNSASTFDIMKSTDNGVTFLTIFTTPFPVYSGTGSGVDAMLLEYPNGNLGFIIMWPDASNKIYYFKERISDINWVDREAIFAPNVQTSSDGVPMSTTDLESGVLVFTSYYFNTLWQGAQYMAFAVTKQNAGWTIIPVRMKKDI